MNRRAFLRRLSEGSVRNVGFGDLVDLAQAFGFRQARVRGSHHIFAHPTLSELLNLQDVEGEAKPYQIRQLLRLVERYNLTMEDQP